MDKFKKCYLMIYPMLLSFFILCFIHAFIDSNQEDLFIFAGILFFAISTIAFIVCLIKKEKK